MSPDPVAPVAVVCDNRGGAADDLRDYLQAAGLSEARWYAPRDVDELDAAVRAGAVRQVVFPALADLLEPIWNREIDFEAWLAAGTAIRFAHPPANDPAAYAGALHASWQRWERARRRRQTVAAVVLSLLALAAAFVLVWIV